VFAEKNCQTGGCREETFLRLFENFSTKSGEPPLIRVELIDNKLSGETQASFTRWSMEIGNKTGVGYCAQRVFVRVWVALLFICAPSAMFGVPMPTPTRAMWHEGGGKGTGVGRDGPQAPRICTSCSTGYDERGGKTCGRARRNHRQVTRYLRAMSRKYHEVRASPDTWMSRRPPSPAGCWAWPP